MIEHRRRTPEEELPAEKDVDLVSPEEHDQASPELGLSRVLSAIQQANSAMSEAMETMVASLRGVTQTFRQSAPKQSKPDPAAAVEKLVFRDEGRSLPAPLASPAAIDVRIIAPLPVPIAMQSPPSMPMISPSTPPMASPITPSAVTPFVPPTATLANPPTAKIAPSPTKGPKYGQVSKLVQQVRIVAPLPLAVKLAGPLQQSGSGKGSSSEKAYANAFPSARKAVGAGMHLLQNASPDAFATLTGSFKLLSAVIGKELVPYAAVASRFLQDTAHDFEHMSREKRAWIGLGTAVAVASGAAFLFLPQLSAVAKLMNPVLGGAAGLAMSHPVVAGSLAAGAALVAYGQYQQSSLKEHYDTKVGEAQANVHGRTVNEIKQTPEFREAEQVSREKGYRAGSGRIMDRLEEAHKAARAATARVQDLYGADDGSRGWLTQQLHRMQGGFNVLHRPEAIKQAQSELVNAQKKGASLEEAAKLFTEGETKFQQDRFKNLPDVKKRNDSQIVQANSLLQSYQNRVQPSYNSVEDQYRKIQLAAVSESPLDQEIRRIQRESLDELMKSNGTLREILNRTGLPAIGR